MPRAEARPMVLPRNPRTYQSHRVPHSCILAHDSAVYILAEPGGVVVDVCEVDADRGHSAESWGAAIFGFHRQEEPLVGFIVQAL